MPRSRDQRRFQLLLQSVSQEARREGRRPASDRENFSALDLDCAVTRRLRRKGNAGILNVCQDFIFYSFRLRVRTASISVGRLTRSKFKVKEPPKEKLSAGKKMNKK